MRTAQLWENPHKCYNVRTEIADKNRLFIAAEDLKTDLPGRTFCEQEKLAAAVRRRWT